MTMFNWYKKLYAYLKPSIVPLGVGNPLFLTGQQSRQQTTAELIAELKKQGLLQPITPAPRSTDYTPNPYTQRQLAQFSTPQASSVQQSPYYQQYLDKMAGYGAGAGKTAPSITDSGAK